MMLAGAALLSTSSTLCGCLLLLSSCHVRVIVCFPPSHQPLNFKLFPPIDVHVVVHIGDLPGDRFPRQKYPHMSRLPVRVQLKLSNGLRLDGQSMNRWSFLSKRGGDFVHFDVSKDSDFLPRSFFAMERLRGEAVAATIWVDNVAFTPDMYVSSANSYDNGHTICFQIEKREQK